MARHDRRAQSDGSGEHDSGREPESASVCRSSQRPSGSSLADPHGSGWPAAIRWSPSSTSGSTGPVSSGSSITSSMRAGRNGRTPGRRLLSDVAYAKTKNVKIWIWVHSRTVLDAQARKEYFRKAVAAGVVGIKIDFPPPASREVANWYFDTAKDAADAAPDGGLPRREQAQRNAAHLAERDHPRGRSRTRVSDHSLSPVPEPDHDVMLPFTRYVAGPGDYTPTVFTTSELMGNTWAHELAQAVVFTSPFLCFGGHRRATLKIRRAMC